MGETKPRNTNKGAPLWFVAGKRGRANLGLIFPMSDQWDDQSQQTPSGMDMNKSVIVFTIPEIRQTVSLIATVLSAMNFGVHAVPHFLHDFHEFESND